jgi:hypothetical protein
LGRYWAVVKAFFYAVEGSTKLGKYGLLDTRKPTILAAIYLLLILLLPGCTPDPQEATVPRSPEGIVFAAQNAGLEAELGEEQPEDWTGLVAGRIMISGENVLVYPLEGSATADAFQERVLDGSDPSPASQWWVSDHLAVNYAGAEGGVVLFLISLFGEPILGPGVVGEEPYPPAIPKAIQAVAEEYGVSPTSAEVLQYEETEWPDACLGVPEVSELCADVITPGWLVQLRVEGQEIEVHTDFLGDQVRWETP